MFEFDKLGTAVPDGTLRKLYCDIIYCILYIFLILHPTILIYHTICDHVSMLLRICVALVEPHVSTAMLCGVTRCAQLWRLTMFRQTGY